jgi:hypothetical protein
MGLTAAAIISLAGSFIPAAIQAAEMIFSGRGTGATKKQTVMESIKALLDAASKAGRAPGTAIPSEIEAAIEATLAALKQIGAVPSSPTSTTDAAAAAGGKMQISGSVTLTPAP